MAAKPKIDWREAPFVRLLISLSAGILAAEFLPIFDPLSINLLLAVAMSCSVYLVFARLHYFQLWWFGIPLSISLFLLGIQMVFYRNELNEGNHFGKKMNFTKTKNDTYVLAKVTDATEREKNFRLVLEVEKMGATADSMEELSGNLLIYIRKDTGKTPPQYQPTYGDLVLINSSIQIIEPPKNPDAFDFQKHWHRQNIHYQAFVSAADVQLLAQKQGNPIVQLAQTAQTRLLTILKKHLTTEREFAVGSALLLGYRDAVTPEVRDAYVETGSMHLLAVSGMHVLVLFKMLEWVLDFYKSGNRRWRWAKAIVAIIVVCLFSLLTGLTSSVLRAAVMAIFLSIGKAMQTRTNTYNILAAAAFTLLLYNPLWLFDAGFQLSFLAVVGIVFFQPKLMKLWIFRIDDDTKMRKRANKVVQWIGESVMTGIAAQLVVTPISLYYFHQFPTYFWLSSVVGVALSNVALVFGVLLFFTDWLSVVGVFMGKILFGFLFLLNEFVFLLQKFPFSIFDGFWWSTGFTVFTYAILLGIALVLSERRLRAFFTPLSMVTVLSAFYAFSTIRQTHQRQVTIYNVYKNTVLDFVEGNACWSFSTVDKLDLESGKRADFATKNHRIKLEINELYSFPHDTLIKVENLLWQNGCVQFHELKFLFLDRMPPTDFKLNVDYLVIHNSAKIDLKTLGERVQFKQIIFDASNSRRNVDMWKSLCISLGYSHFDINQQGAFVLDF